MTNCIDTFDRALQMLIDKPNMPYEEIARLAMDPDTREEALAALCCKAYETMGWALEVKRPSTGSTDPCVMACQDIRATFREMFAAICEADKAQS